MDVFEVFSLKVLSISTAKRREIPVHKLFGIRVVTKHWLTVLLPVKGSDRKESMATNPGVIAQAFTFHVY